MIIPQNAKKVNSAYAFQSYFCNPSTVAWTISANLSLSPTSSTRYNGLAFVYGIISSMQYFACSGVVSFTFEHSML